VAGIADANGITELQPYQNTSLLLQQQPTQTSAPPPK
jgi:hypothetical protein